MAVAGVIAVLLAVACGTSGPPSDEGDAANPARVGDFFNVVAPDGADPWVIRQPDGWYYATVTTGRDVTLLRSRTISGLGGGERRVIYRPPRTLKNLWAPEIHPVGGRWYVYFAADDGDNANHRMYALENPSADPFLGEFAPKGRVFDPDHDRWAIDGHAFTSGGRAYFVWSGWEGTENVAQNLYIAPMSNPWTLAGPRILISKPTLEWEARGAPPAINEGPQVLIRGDRVHLIYSASGSWTDHYCLGMLTAKPGGDLLSPSTWEKHSSPVFESADGVFGPGHNSFVKSPDGREDWLIYHAARWSGSGWTRLIRAQPFAWRDDGTPDFGRPAPPDRPIPLPSGEPPHLRYEAEAASLAGPVRVDRHPGASGGQAVGPIGGGDGGSATFRVRAGRGGTLGLVVRFRGGPTGRKTSTHRLIVNDRPARSIRYDHAGPETWSNAFATIDLAAGENRIRFEAGEGTAEIDCIDLIPRP